MDAIRSQATAPEPVSNVTMEKADPDGGLFATAAAADDEVDLADLRARIDAAIEVLDLTKAHRAMLHMLICPEQETSDAANGRASQATRKARERLRNRIGELACLSPEEARAAALLRKHHTVARAAAASGVNEKDLRDALAFAKRKVLALFDIESED
jgi:hypothetical protein